MASEFDLEKAFKDYVKKEKRARREPVSKRQFIKVCYALCLVLKEKYQENEIEIQPD